MQCRIIDSLHQVLSLQCIFHKTESLSSLIKISPFLLSSNSWRPSFGWCETIEYSLFYVWHFNSCTSEYLSHFCSLSVIKPRWLPCFGYHEQCWKWKTNIPLTHLLGVYKQYIFSSYYISVNEKIWFIETKLNSCSNQEV